MKKDLSIVIDVTSEFSYLYLISNKIKILEFNQYKNEKNLSFSLIEYIKNMLLAHNYELKDINNVYLVYGPGKFSAMRISSVVAKTLNLLLDANLFIIDRFDYLKNDQDCTCVIKSDGNKSFIVKYQNGHKIDEPRLVDNSSLEQLLDDDTFVIYENDNYNQVIKRLADFEPTNYEFLLKYLKDPC